MHPVRCILIRTVRNHILRQRGHLSPLNLVSKLCIKFRRCATARCLYKVPASPLENRNKKQAQIRINHINFQMTILSAVIAHDRLVKVQFLLSLADSHDKKHPDSPL